MSYSQEISRANKGLFVFLLDQSFSMEDPLGGAVNAKMDELATAVNSWLQEMTIRTTGSEGIRDYFDIGMIGYRTDDEANPIIESPLTGDLRGQELVSIVDIYNNTRMETKTQSYYDEDDGEMKEREVDFPVWIEAKAEGGTPMCSALHEAYEVVSKWIEEHPRSFPPIVLHISDGENQEAGDPLDYADPLRSLETEDGNVLLLNCHLSEEKAQPFMFPHSNEILPNDHARVLFDMSSILPESFIAQARDLGFEVQEGAKGMAFNADMVSLIRFLDIGTRVAATLR